MRLHGITSSSRSGIEIVVLIFFFFFNDTATTEIYTLSLHDALPISWATRIWPTFSRATTISRGNSDRKSTRLNSSHLGISYAVFCLKKKQAIYTYAQHHGPTNHTSSPARTYQPR